VLCLVGELIECHAGGRPGLSGEPPHPLSGQIKKKKKGGEGYVSLVKRVREGLRGQDGKAF